MTRSRRARNRIYDRLGVPPGNTRNAFGNGATKLGIGLEEYVTRAMAGYKWCYACRSWHARREFHANRAARDGKAERCKLCDKKANIAYQIRREQRRLECGVA